MGNVFNNEFHIFQGNKTKDDSTPKSIGSTNRSKPKPNEVNFTKNKLSEGTHQIPSQIGVTPFLRMTLPYLAVSPVMTIANAYLALS